MHAHGTVTALESSIYVKGIIIFTKINKRLPTKVDVREKPGGVCVCVEGGGRVGRGGTKERRPRPN